MFPFTQDFFLHSFSNFRASRDARPGARHRSAAAPYRARVNPLYSMKVICLEGPHQAKINSMLVRRLNANGLGREIHVIIPPANNVLGYIGIILSVCSYLVLISATPPKLLNGF